MERASRDGAEGRDAKPRHRLGLPTKAMLTLELDDSHVVVVDEANSGSRALAFAGRAFREPLGRVDAEYSAHASCKTAAQSAVQDGRLQINGKRAAGRQTLDAGDVVSLMKAALDASSASSNPKRSRRDGRHSCLPHPCSCLPHPCSRLPSLRWRRRASKMPGETPTAFKFRITLPSERMCSLG